MTPARLDILTSALSAVARLIMEARSDRDAEALVHQLRAMGPAQRSDVGSIEAERLRELRQDEPTQVGPLDTSPTKTTTGRLYRQPIALGFPGPLGEFSESGHVCGSCKRPLDGGG